MIASALATTTLSAATLVAGDARRVSSDSILVVDLLLDVLVVLAIVISILVSVLVT